MSKAITIQQKGVDVDMTVDKLQVPRAGGSAYWVPEDEVKLHSLKVTVNGTYSAETAGKYGYDYVAVSVPGSSVTGKGQDGNEHTITTDGDGNIVDTKVPSEIRIITPPDYVGPYGDRAYIDFTGLTVEAFYADGTSAGMVDFNDLFFPVTVAEYDPGTAALEYGATYSNAEALHNAEYFSQPLGYVGGGLYSIDNIRDGSPSSGASVFRKYSVPTGVRAVLFRHNSGDGLACVFMSEASDVSIEEQWRYGSVDSYTSETYLLASTTVTVGGKTIYYYGLGIGLTSNDVLQTTFPDNSFAGPYYTFPTGRDGIQDVATIIYDGASAIIGGGTQIPVEWSRPGDGAILETSFGITVVPGPNSGED